MAPNKQQRLDRVRAARKADTESAKALKAAVHAAREAGATWQEIGDALGHGSRQAARQYAER